MTERAAVIPSASVLLLRDGVQDPEVFMVLRHHKIEAFSGALVFPGGKVDAGDADPGLRAHCRGAADLDDKQLAVRIAAIREAYEECGVLLACSAGTESLLDSEQIAALAEYRGRLHRGELSLLTLCREHKLTLALDQLTFYAHWITPKARPRIFDTYFFLAPAPPGQTAEHDGIEASDSMWISPRQAIHDAGQGRITLVFPTRMNLGKLARFRTIRNALEKTSENNIVTVQPEIEGSQQGNIMRIPENAGYGASRVLAHRDGRQFIVLD